MNEIKSKLSWSDTIPFGHFVARIVAKWYNMFTREWVYEVENKEHNFKTTINESELS